MVNVQPCRWEKSLFYDEISKVYHHHHKRQGLGPLARSVSRVTAVPSISSLVFQFSFFLVDCTGMLLRGFSMSDISIKLQKLNFVK